MNADWFKPGMRITCGALALAVVFAISSLVGVSSLSSLRSDRLLVLTIDIIVLVVAALVAIGLAYYLRPDGRREGSHVAAVAPLLAGLGTLAILLAANPFGTASQKQTLRLIDINASTLLALLAGTAAVVTLGALGVVRPAAKPEPADDSFGRRNAIRTMAALALVGAVGTSALVVVTRSTTHLQPSPLAEPIRPPAEPAAIGDVAYRIRLSKDDGWIRYGGPGFLIVSSQTITAYDGKTGTVRWAFNPASIGGPATATDDSNLVTVFGVGKDSTAVIVGKYVTLGLDATTGRELWRSGAPEFRPARGSGMDYARVFTSGDDGQPTTPVVVVIDPRSGAVRWRKKLACPVGYASNASYVVTSVCDKPAEFDITDLNTRETRRIHVTIPPDGWFTSVTDLGEGLFGAFYERVTKPADENANTDPETASSISVFNAESGDEIDHFDPSSQISYANNRMIAMGADYSKDDRTYGRIVFRNLRTQSSTSVPATVDADHFLFSWIGDSLLVRSEVKHRAVPLLVDPRTKTASPQPSACLGHLRDVSIVPGAVLESCGSPDRSWGSREPVWNSEIVGWG